MQPRRRNRPFMTAIHSLFFGCFTATRCDLSCRPSKKVTCKWPVTLNLRNATVNFMQILAWRHGVRPRPRLTGGGSYKSQILFALYLRICAVKASEYLSKPSRGLSPRE
ncbi:hypothetical protein LZ32DRAFT_14212 [Colletotrichum eremochloae]|nr:hypothetical protein LZ32DRAFT_14212 [Colletotrichum eremochloae]